MSGMELTDIKIFGLQNGRCVASAWKAEGKGADKFNRQTVTEWAKRGYDIVTLHKDDPAAKAYSDQMWQDAKVRSVISQTESSQ